MIGAAQTILIGSGAAPPRPPWAGQRPRQRAASYRTARERSRRWRRRPPKAGVKTSSALRHSSLAASTASARRSSAVVIDTNAAYLAARSRQYPCANESAGHPVHVPWPRPQPSSTSTDHSQAALPPGSLEARPVNLPAPSGRTPRRRVEPRTASTTGREAVLQQSQT